MDAFGEALAVVHEFSNAGRVVARAHPFVVVGVVNHRAYDRLSGAPGERRGAVRAPHLVTPFYLVDPRRALGTRLARFEHKRGRLDICIIAHVRRFVVVRGHQTLPTHLLIAHSARMGFACHKPTAIFRGTGA